jgi:MerR family transcriptional regulator/heat shock protein HspR
MQEEFLTREAVCQQLCISQQILLRYEELGLVQPRRQDGEVRYGRDAVRQAWSVVSLHRDLGINLAGIEAIFHLRSQLEEARQQFRAVLELVDKVLAERSQSQEKPR